MDQKQARHTMVMLPILKYDEAMAGDIMYGVHYDEPTQIFIHCKSVQKEERWKAEREERARNTLRFKIKPRGSL